MKTNEQLQKELAETRRKLKDAADTLQDLSEGGHNSPAAKEIYNFLGVDFNNKYRFRLHVTIAEIQARIDCVLASGGDKIALEEQVYKPLLETFENKPTRFKHNQYKRGIAKGYVEGRLKQQNDILR